jgi:hypothetical protein
MREADAPSTGEVAMLSGACPPHRGRHGLTTDAPAQRSKGAKLRAAPDRSKGAAKGIIEAGVLHLASLQRESLILHEDCYNAVT